MGYLKIVYPVAAFIFCNCKLCELHALSVTLVAREASGTGLSIFNRLTLRYQCARRCPKYEKCLFFTVLKPVARIFRKGVT